MFHENFDFLLTENTYSRLTKNQSFIEIDSMKNLSSSIEQTITFYDLFDYPLTANEIFNNLFQPTQDYSYFELIKTLEMNNTLEFDQGFYFLPGRFEIVAKRKKRYLITEQKIKNNLKYIKLLSRIKAIKTIFICNTVAYHNAQEDSDLDLFIITRKNRIWSTRLLTTLLMKIFNKRPTKTDQKDKICLSFFITEDNLSLENIAIKNDVYLYYWISQLLPIYDPENLHKEFWQGNNWLKKYLPNADLKITNTRWQVKDALLKFPTLPEYLARKIQLKKMPNHLKKLSQENNTNVIINDKILKFHDQDKRVKIREQFFK
jgi:hypothetical protein